MKILLFAIYCSIFLVSCTSNSQSHHIETKKTIDKGFRITINDEIVNDNSFVELANYVFLESNNPIAGIDRLILHNDTIIILDKKGQSIHFYGQNGAFISRINNRGRGPGEYTNLNDITVDHDARNIIVLDRNSKKILYYNFDGVFQKEFDLGWRYHNKIASIKNSIFLHNESSRIYSKEQRESYNSLLKYDMNSNNIVGYFAEKNSLSHISLGNKAFFRNGKNIFFNDRLSFDVYKINTSEISRLFTLNFHDNEEFIDYCKEISSINDLLDSDFAFDITDICITEKFISFKYHKERRAYNLVYNRDQRKIIFHSDNFMFTSSELLNRKILTYSHPKFVHNEQFISIIQPSMIKDIYDNLTINNASEDLSKVVDRIKNMDINDNPILVFYKFSHN